MWFGATLEPWSEQARQENLFPQVEDKSKLRFWGNAFRRGEANLNATFVTGLDGTNALDLSRAEIECRRQAIALTAFLKRHVPGFESVYVMRTAPHIGVRETRRFVGDYYLTYDDFIREAKFPDGIARSGFFVDIHDPKPTGSLHIPDKGDMPEGGGDFDVPYRALLPQGVENLILAGRCISASSEAFASARVTGTVMAMGHAAGTAAAMAVQQGCTPRALPVAALREQLLRERADLGVVA